MDITFKSNGSLPKPGLATSADNHLTIANFGQSESSTTARDPVTIDVSPMAIAMENAAAMQGATPDVLAGFMASLAGSGLLTPIMNFTGSGTILRGLLGDSAAEDSARRPSTKPAPAAGTTRNTARIIALVLSVQQRFSESASVTTSGAPLPRAGSDSHGDN